MEAEKKGLKGLILGATGSTGRDLVRELLGSPEWSEVTVIVRRVLEEWTKLNPEQAAKLKIVTVPSLDELEDIKKWEYKGYNSLFCCLGGQTGKDGKAMFVKSDYTYPVLGGKIAKANNIPHYSLISSIGADKSSWFLYPKTKGQAEDTLTKEGLPYLTIHRPGLIENRDNDKRLKEKIAGLIPFMPKISSKDIGKTLRLEAEQLHLRGPDGRRPVLIYENKNMLNLLKNKTFLK
jgi:oxidoreductase